MKKILAIVFLMLLLMAAVPTSGYAVVDGAYTNTNEWILARDFFSAMGEGFDPAEKHASDLYLKYACYTQTLFALVRTVDGYVLDQTGDVWIAINGNPANKLTQTGLAYFPDYEGLEASYDLAPGNYTILAHVDVNGGETSGTEKDFIDLNINCTPNAVTITNFSARPSFFNFLFGLFGK